MTTTGLTKRLNETREAEIPCKKWGQISRRLSGMVRQQVGGE